LRVSDLSKCEEENSWPHAMVASRSCVGASVRIGNGFWVPEAVRRKRLAVRSPGKRLPGEFTVCP
jgi:hypothetical protein